MDTEGLREHLYRQRARELRERSTDVEALLWRRLRNRQVANFKFRRQHPWGTYILDFFCPAAKVAIE
ncbi:MAG: DUF559 domain-containing protein, partial [Aestuariibacter sp.]|nr:DUF559 domain-containing protein [Aestuariibacter sp.]